MKEKDSGCLWKDNAEKIFKGVVDNTFTPQVKMGDAKIRAMIFEYLTIALPQEIRDLRAYIEWSDKQKDRTWVRFNILHDITGTVNQISCFHPRTSGYECVLNMEVEKHA